MYVSIIDMGGIPQENCWMYEKLQCMAAIIVTWRNKLQQHDAMGPWAAHLMFAVMKAGAVPFLMRRQ